MTAPECPQPEIGEVLCRMEYIPEDDSWDMDGRRTYINDNNLTPAFFTALMNGLLYSGWKRKPRTLRTFLRDGEIIEVEPGGADASGHYLHHMKAEIA